MRLRKHEVKALAALLEQGAETPEKLAEIVATELDRLRAERTTYVAVVRHFSGAHTFYTGMGPYATQHQAGQAIEKSPYEGTAYAVVPVRSAEGYEQLLADLDAKPASKGDFALVAEDALAFRRGWRGHRSDRDFHLKKGAWG